MKFLSFTIITVLSLSIFGCANKKEPQNQQNTTEQKLPLKNLRAMQNRDATGVAKPITNIKGFDPCDCNKKSQTIMDKTIAVRKKFSSIAELKSDKESKQLIKKLATEYNTLVATCFEANAAKLFEESECNDLKILGEKKDLLYSMGVQIDLGANIKL